MHILRPLEDTPTIKKPMTMVIDQSIFVKQITRATTRKPHPDRHKWSWQHPNSKKIQLDHVILREKWINSLRNCSCYNTLEIDSDHRIVAATVKFSCRTRLQI